MEINAGLAGWFKFETFRTEVVDGEVVEIPGSRKVALDWFPNLITDGGLDAIGSCPANFNAYFHVGSGNTPPANSDTQLANWMAGTSNSQSVTNGVVGPPYYFWGRQVRRFSAGEVIGIIREVGVGWTSNGVGLFSRALILDGTLTPTFLELGADESLDITYEVRKYAPASDATGTVTIAGEIYDWTARPIKVGQYGYPQFPWTSLQSNIEGSASSFKAAISGYEMTDQLNTPSWDVGVADFPASKTCDAYVPGSHKVTANFKWNTTPNPNLYPNYFVRCVIFSVGGCAFQVGMYHQSTNEGPPKSTDNEITFHLTINWARY